MTELAFQPWNSSNPEATSPRETIVVAGEFEVGKSSVVNALLRRALVPNDPGFVSRPLVRVCHSPNTIVRAELTDGSLLEVDSVAEIVEREDVAVCTILTPMPGMEAVEIIEVPFSPVNGFDDRHLPIMRASGMFIWVTIASQAWRLSEKSAVQGLPKEMRDRSILAISRADKLRTEEDLDRIETRLQKEAAPFFNELVFIQASAKNLAMSESDEDGWAATGGQALFEIASEIIGEISADEEIIAEQVARTVFGRRASDRDDVQVDLSEMEMAERELDRKFRTVDELSRSQDGIGAAIASVPAAVQITADEDTSFEQELEHSLNEIVEEFGSEEDEEQGLTDAVDSSDDVVPTDEVEETVEIVDEEPIASVEAAVVPNADPTEAEIASEPEPELEASIEPEPATELEMSSDPEPKSLPERAPASESEPEPAPKIESAADRISRAVDNVDGLITAGVGELKSLEIRASFKEGNVSANQCLAAFSGMIEADAQAMRQLQTDDTVQEVIIAAGNSLILLQRLEENTTEIAFFVLQGNKTNAGICAMQTKRLLSVWRDCRDEG